MNQMLTGAFVRVDVSTFTPQQQRKINVDAQSLSSRHDHHDDNTTTMKQPLGLSSHPFQCSSLTPPSYRARTAKTVAYSSFWAFERESIVTLLGVVVIDVVVKGVGRGGPWD